MISYLSLHSVRLVKFFVCIRIGGIVCMAVYRVDKHIHCQRCGSHLCCIYVGGIRVLPLGCTGDAVRSRLSSIPLLSWLVFGRKQLEEYVKWKAKASFS